MKARDTHGTFRPEDKDMKVDRDASPLQTTIEESKGLDIPTEIKRLEGTNQTRPLVAPEVTGKKQV